MRDGLQVIARLPYPSTQPKALATASEVATMDLVRSYEIPIPRVYGYSTNSDNPVGTEYILMEKIPGQCPGDIWFDLPSDEKVKIMKTVIDQEVSLSKIAFPAYGSVYYDVDLPKEMGRQHVLDKGGKFCIGPDASLEQWFGTRSELDIRRGHTTTPIEVLQQGAKKELAWLKTYGKRRFPFDTVYRGMFNYEEVDPKEHISSLKRYLQVAQELVPVDPLLHRPVLRHPDLNLNNILVDDSHNIVGIIDWQHASVLPLFLDSGAPKAFANHEDSLRDEFKQPEQCSGFGHSSEPEIDPVTELIQRLYVHNTYMSRMAAKLPENREDMNYEAAHRVQGIWKDSKAPWEGNSVPLQAGLVRLADDWSELAAVKATPSACPIQFDEKEAEDILQKETEQANLDLQMALLRAQIGITVDGWMPHERYDHAAKQAAETKEEALQLTEDDVEREMMERHWPFDDRDEEE